VESNRKNNVCPWQWEHWTRGNCPYLNHGDG